MAGTSGGQIDNPGVKHSFTPGTMRPAHERGFTIIELMVVVVVLAVVATLATPAWRTLQVRNQVRTLVNDYTLSIYFARSEAVRQNTAVSVCPSSDGTVCTNSALEDGWIVIVGLPNAVAPVLLQDTLPRPFVRTAFANNALANRSITFLPNGQVAANYGGNTLRVCAAEDGFGAVARELAISRAARLTVTTPGACNIP